MQYSEFLSVLSFKKAAKIFPKIAYYFYLALGSQFKCGKCMLHYNMNEHTCTPLPVTNRNLVFIYFIAYS